MEIEEEKKIEFKKELSLLKNSNHSQRDAHNN